MYIGDEKAAETKCTGVTDLYYLMDKSTNCT